MIMRKFTLSISVIFALFISHNIVAQLYVNNNYVYVADNYLYVKQDVNIQNTGTLFLRNESQLLQASNSTSTNTGSGKLAVFQEGTVNNYAYNYWCSPVGNASPLIGNESFGVSFLNRPTSLTTSVSATIINPGLDGVTTNSSLSIASRWVFKYLSSSLYSQWISVGSASTIAAGEGFTMKGSSGTDTAFSENGINNNPGNAQRYDFRGKPNDGNIDISVGIGKRTLTGNPYPSAIDLQAFLLGASNSTGIAYFWEQDKTVNSHYIAAYKGGYGSYAAGSNTYIPAVFYAYDGAGTSLGSVGTGGTYIRKFSPIGQGFMIEGSANGIVTMKNTYRVFQKENPLFSHFEKNSSTQNNSNTSFYPAIPSVSGFDYTTESSSPSPQIRLNVLLDNQAVRQLALTFNDSATDDVDFAFDAKSLDESATDSYFVINSNEFGIEAVAFDINKRIPIGFKNSSTANFKITLSDMINFNQAENVYIHDKENDVYHDIKNSVFEVTLPSGTNNSRFEITFVNQLLNNPTLSETSFDIIQNNDVQEMTLYNPSLLNIKLVTMYDISGKIIFTKTKLGSNNKYLFSTSGISDGVYITKIKTIDNQEFAKKIPIMNLK